MCVTVSWLTTSLDSTPIPIHGCAWGFLPHHQQAVLYASAGSPPVQLSSDPLSAAAAGPTG